MNKTILSIILALAIVASLSLALTSAEVNETNLIRYGVIEINGTLTTTNTPITNANIIGFVCSAPDCSTVVGTLFGGQVLNTGINSEITVTYPTILQSLGYGLFVYETGYIPYEIKANWAGTGQAPTAPDYLTRKALCTVPINSFNSSFANGSITVSATVQSPINNAGPLNYIPASIASQYSADVQLNVTLTGPASANSFSTLNIPFSGTQSKTINFPVQQSGNYTITATASTNDAKCLSSQLTTQNSLVNVPSSSNQTNQTIRCYTDVECGGVYPFGNPFCSGNSVVRIFVANNCINPGTPQSYCSSSNNTITLETCSFQCSNGMCINQTNQTSPIFLKVNNPVANTTYTNNTQLLNITAINATNVWYNINNAPNITYTSPILVNFPNGTVLLNVFANNTFGDKANTSITFTVNPGNQSNQTNPISLTILSPLSQTYTVNDILVNIRAINATNVWYSINGAANQTYTNSFTFSFPNGANTLKAYANDTLGNFASASVSFTVSPPSPPCTSNCGGNGGGDGGGNNDEVIHRNFTRTVDAPPITASTSVFQEESSATNKTSLNGKSNSFTFSSNLSLIMILLGVLCILLILIIIFIASAGTTRARSRPMSTNPQNKVR